MKATRPRVWSSRSLTSLSVAAALLLVGPAVAHEVLIPIEGDSIAVQTNTGPGNEQFSFESIDNNVIAGHDPRVDPTRVLVRGVGADPGRTPVILLSPSGWSGSDRMYSYEDPTGANGGITSATLEDGLLRVEASGENWPWSPAGEQDEVWVHVAFDNEWYCAVFDAAGGTAVVSANEAGHFAATDAPAPAACPDQICGNGVQEPGEECDDGNLVEDDGCTSLCAIGECASPSFDTTFDGIQSVIFDSPVYQCANAACHGGETPAGGLDLTEDDSFVSLLGEDGLGAPSTGSLLRRVEPAEPSLSLLYSKLAAATNGTAAESGSPMPTGGAPALTDSHLEAVRLWIRGGAPEDRVVIGTAPLLGTCLPDPDPLKIPIPEPPGRDTAGDSTGVQLRQPPWQLPGLTEDSQGEDEICMATFYDLTETDLVPEWADVDCPPFWQAGVSNPGGKCMRLHEQVLYQDPQSHHSLIYVYRGVESVTHPGWGDWTYKFEPDDPEADKNGEPCDPTQNIDPELGYHRGCSGAIVSDVACLTYGPEDATTFFGNTMPQISGSQEPYYEQELADGVYSTMPKRAIVVWNSHAFNLTPKESTMAQYLSFWFARPEDQQVPSEQLFDRRWIFASNTPPFEKQEICGSYTLPQHANLFWLSSHTHIRGVDWRTWAPPNEPCRAPCTGSRLNNQFGLCDLSRYCSNDSSIPCGSDSRCGPDGRCVELPVCEGPREDVPIYRSTDYSDPLQLPIDPPMVFDSPDPVDRTFLYCSVFDNGSEESSPPVKQQSTSPLPPPVLNLPPQLSEPVAGGPCPNTTVACLDGPKKGQPCGGEPDPDGFCGGEGLCDACPAHGGFTTEDEMFILLGNYFVRAAPEPASPLLGIVALGALGLLGRGRRGRS